MQKIISLFQRNYDTDHLVRDEVVPGAEWVLNGEGVPTRKWDGVTAMYRDGVLYRRQEVKPGQTPPEGFEPAQEPDAVTGDTPGWVPQVLEGKGADKRFVEALENWRAFYRADPENGTYEVCGPKVNGNPEHFDRHLMIPHGAAVLVAPRTFDGLHDWFINRDIEGIVWHHPDGRMAKIKKKDFGLSREPALVAP